jgi:hypothetical protein
MLLDFRDVPPEDETQETIDERQQTIDRAQKARGRGAAPAR